MLFLLLPGNFIVPGINSLTKEPVLSSNIILDSIWFTYILAEGLSVTVSYFLMMIIVINLTYPIQNSICQVIQFYLSILARVF